MTIAEIGRLVDEYRYLSLISESIRVNDIEKITLCTTHDVEINIHSRETKCNISFTVLCAINERLNILKEELSKNNINT